MSKDLYKCCFCLNTVRNPVIMCYQTHVACFNCVCSHIRCSDKSECPLCREHLRTRLDRLITESAKCMHRSKRRKTNDEEDAYTVFLKLLDLKDKQRFKIFTTTLKRFAIATETKESIIQMSEDINNIMKARKSGQRLLEHKLYDPVLHSHMHI